MSYRQNKRFYTSTDMGHRHSVDVAMNGFGQPLTPYAAPMTALSPALMLQILRAPAARRGFGQLAPGWKKVGPSRQPPVSAEQVGLLDVVTRDGVSFKLLKPEALVLAELDDTFVTPTAGNTVEYGGVKIPGAAVAWGTFQPTAEKLTTWMKRIRADGQALLVTDMEAGLGPPTIDGKPFDMTHVDGMGVATRDLDLVGAISARDSGAIVFFEPSAGWKRPGTMKAVLIGGAVLTLAALGAAALMRRKR